MRKNFLVLLIFVICGVAYAQSLQNSSQQNTTEQTPPWPTKEIENALSSFLISIFISTSEPILPIINALLAVTPDVSSLSSVHYEILKLLAPLYIFVLSLNAVEIMISDVVSTQAKARITIQNSMVSMVLVIASLPIYNILLSLSLAISKAMLSANFKPVITNVLSLSLLSAAETPIIPILMLLDLSGLLVIVFLLLRFYVIEVGVLLFPIGIFMYFFSPLRRFGKMIISTILYFIFIQLIFSLIIFVMNALIEAPPASLGFSVINEMITRILIYTGGLILLSIIPLLIFVQIILVITFPEFKLFSTVTSFAGSVTAAGRAVSSEVEVV
jgi:hypothetical protein